MKPFSKNSEDKKIWIDLDNSPHVPFFKPIIRELENKGYGTHITARDCFQTCGLADRAGLQYRRVGRHYGKIKIVKILGTLFRSLQLTISVRKEKPTLFVCHGSRSGLIASAMLRIPIIVILDYEFVQKVPFIHPAKIIIPESISSDNYMCKGISVAHYPGIKEDVYVPEFRPDPSLLDELSLNNNDLIATIRPPATEAHYHNPESEKLFASALNFLGKQPGIKMVILPRNEKKQTKWIMKKWSKWVESGKIIIPGKVVDGLNLMWYSDLVISGGGTMNREAAALGVPVYSIFRGRIGAVDHYLANNGRLVLLETIEDVRSKIQVAKRKKSTQAKFGEKPALNKIVAEIVKVIQ